MSDLTIVTNNIPREVLNGWDLTPAERAEFDYIDWDAIERGEDSASFVRYKGEIYDLGDLESSHLQGGHPFPEWDAWVSESFFSGVLFRWPREGHDSIDSDHVIVGRYYS